MPYRILNWHKYQARKSRGSNPWVKLYKKLLDSADFHGIPEVYRWQWVGLMLLADDNTGCINYSDAEIAFRLRVSEWSCKPFIGKMIEELDATGIPLVNQRYTSGCVEEKRREEKRITTSARRRSVERSAPEDVLLEIPCIGNPDTFQLTKAKVAEWERLYGVALNVRREILRAVQWLKDNPSKAKTARGMTRYLNGWLDREVNRNPIRATPKAQTQPGAYGGTCPACSDLGVLRIDSQWQRCACSKARGISDADLAKANEGVPA